MKVEQEDSGFEAWWRQHTGGKSSIVGGKGMAEAAWNAAEKGWKPIIITLETEEEAAWMWVAKAFAKDEGEAIMAYARDSQVIQLPPCPFYEGQLSVVYNANERKYGKGE